MLEIRENIAIKDYSTFRIGGVVKYFAEISSLDDLIFCLDFAKRKVKKIFILGGGSNTIFPDGLFDVFVIKVNIKGFNIIKEGKTFIDVEVGAGEIFDEIIKKTIGMNLSGLEALSFIPGTIGATPIQNVGAYGVEVGNLIKEIKVFDMDDSKIKIITNKKCHFDYRDSIFKSNSKGRYVILYVVYRLSKKEPKIPNYNAVLEYLKNKNIINPGLKDIREAIISVRLSKLPDWKVLPNSGSFFENPIVSKTFFNNFKKNYPNVKTFSVGKNKFKIPAGWLIENSGLKGRSFGKISVYDKNALVLINNGGATNKDLLYAKDGVIKAVKDKFNIILEAEPNIL